MKRHIVIAPHADDEIIGCYSILCSGEVDFVYFPFTNGQAVKEAHKSAFLYGFTPAIFIEEDLPGLAEKALKKKGSIFFPDPVYDFHPEHRIIGALGEKLLRRGYPNVVFYSTNMNAPYIREVESPDQKRTELSQCYKQKESLWLYDHRYFLFEGQCKWFTDIEWLD